MSKILSMFIFIFSSFSIFAQNIKDYTPLTAGNIGDAARLTQNKYVAPCDIVTTTIQGQKVHIFESVTFSGRTLIAFDMTALQEKELDTIRGTRDTPLVLFTRRGTNKNDYRFVVDRLIPLKNVFGVVSNDLPRSFSTKDFYEVLDLYIQSQKTDPDGRVAKKVQQAQAEVDRTREIERTETARRLEAAKREEFLNNAIVGGGYKSLIRADGLRESEIAKYEKIVVLGSLRRDDIHTQNVMQILHIRNSDDILAEISIKEKDIPQEARSYYYPIFLFLTKVGEYYTLDKYEFYYNLIKDQPGELPFNINIDIIDAWIIKNSDK